MKLLLLLFALGSISPTFALNIGFRDEKPIKFNTVTIEGPECTSSIQNTTIYDGDHTNATNPMVVAIVTFDAMTATTNPKTTNLKSQTDCTIAVDFTFPKGYQMSEAFVVMSSTVTWTSGLVRDATLDISFPTIPNYLVSDVLCSIDCFISS
jgi:hypothetical protein